tara:strand:- start:42 stop:569 length:528 start_codon:yes stop_codon:yes gene_type:complete
MDIKFYIDPIFKINFLKIECSNFKYKKEKIKKVLKKYPEKRQQNFSTSRFKNSFDKEFKEIFNDELNIVRSNHNNFIDLYDVWSVSYKKGDYHAPHNHGSKGYCGILYLDMHKDSPPTTYIQPWNDDNDKSKLFRPPVNEGDIIIIPQFLYHFTEPNLIKFKKRIISFDYNLGLN